MPFITPILAYGTVALDLVLVAALAAYLARRSWGKGTVRWIGMRAVLLGFLTSLAAIIGSLLYSNVVGYAPCELCWWQRICLYPLAVIFGVALYKKDKRPFDYALPLASIAAVLAIYHTYIQLGGTTSILPCTAFGGACTKVYVLTLGYVTIPTMSLSIALTVILLALINNYHDKDRNT